MQAHFNAGSLLLTCNDHVFQAIKFCTFCRQAWRRRLWGTPPPLPNYFPFIKKAKKPSSQTSAFPVSPSIQLSSQFSCWKNWQKLKLIWKSLKESFSILKKFIFICLKLSRANFTKWLQNLTVFPSNENLYEMPTQTIKLKGNLPL